MGLSLCSSPSYNGLILVKHKKDALYFSLTHLCSLFLVAYPLYSLVADGKSPGYSTCINPQWRRQQAGPLDPNVHRGKLKSSVLVELIFWGCKMDIYMTLLGEKKPQNPTQKTIWPVILSQFHFTSLYGTYLHPATYEMDLVSLNS